MINAELISKIKAEIEGLKSIEYPCDNSQQATGFFNALDRMTDFLSTLESEKPTNQKGLDVTDFCKPIEPGIAQCIADHFWEMLGEDEKPVQNDLEEAADKFAVFYDQGTCDGIAQDCFIAGAKWNREQMMKEAIGGNAYPNDGEIWVDLARYGYKFKEGEPCRIIIVKE